VRRIAIAIGATLSGLVLLFSWPTSTNSVVGAAARSSGGTGGVGRTAGGTETAGGTTTTGAVQTFTGAPAQTRYGDVQVEIAVTDGVITDATAIAFPDAPGTDQRINSYAIPILQDETIAAQGSSIDMVSGATVTSRGYLTSLQNALDQAAL
jgi:uncharacterized protein with FMN-binding domain